MKKILLATLFLVIVAGSWSKLTLVEAAVIECNSQAALSTTLHEQMNLRNTSVSVRLRYSFSFSQVEAIIDAVLFDILTFDDYLNFSMLRGTGENYYESQWSGSNNDVQIDFTFRYKTTYAQEQEINSRVAQILAAELTAGMNDEEKLKALHDWVVLNVAYDKSLTRNSIYDALFDGSAVCEGYALLLFKLLRTAGIPARIVEGTGKGEAHAWNLVYLCSAWFHVDATWDDPLVNGADVPGRVVYDYYCLSDAEIDDDHLWDRVIYSSYAATLSYVEGICALAPQYAYNYYVPYLSNDNSTSRWTGMALANAENQGAEVRITCYGMNGSQLDQEKKTLAADGQGVFVAQTPSGIDGWIKIESTRKLDGLALIGQLYPPLMFDIDMKSSLHNSFLLAHLAADLSDWNSIVMACNPNSTGASLTFKYYNQSGVLVTSRSASIAAGGSVQQDLRSLFGQDLNGSMVIESTQPITAFMLYDSRTTNWRAGLSALEL